jgi:hypothetical protein
VGTGFLVKMGPSDLPKSAQTVYLVTAKHVVEKALQSGHEFYARVNAIGPREMALLIVAGRETDRREKVGDRRDIGQTIEQLRTDHPGPVLALEEEIRRDHPTMPEGAQFVDIGGVGNWFFHEDPSVDAAVFAWRPSLKLDDWEFPLKYALTPALMTKEGIGLGDDVFVAGLFSRRTGHARNIPIVRVGNIAALPEEPIETAMGLQEAYLIELLSIGGLSGSPVFTYLGGIRRESAQAGAENLHYRSGAIHLLGLVHGHWNAASQDRMDAATDALDGGERVNMGIAIVVPIIRVLEILNYPGLRTARENAGK